MKKIIATLIIVCVSIFGLCSCGSEEKSIVGTWSTELSHTTFKFIFADDNTGEMKTIDDIDNNRNETINFTWEIHSTYTFTDENGEKITFEPIKYDGVLILNDDDIIDIEDIAYYRFDENKERIYFASPNDNKSETSYTRE